MLCYNLHYKVKFLLSFTLQLYICSNLCYNIISVMLYIIKFWPVSRCMYACMYMYIWLYDWMHVCNWYVCMFVMYVMYAWMQMNVCMWVWKYACLMRLSSRMNPFKYIRFLPSFKTIPSEALYFTLFQDPVNNCLPHQGRQFTTMLPPTMVFIRKGNYNLIYLRSF